MSKEKFFAAYYSDTDIPKETVFHVIKVIADTFEIPATKIRPTDSFDQDFSPIHEREWGDEIVEISWFIQRKMKEAGVYESVQLNTVDEVIRFVARLEKHQETRTEKGTVCN